MGGVFLETLVKQFVSVVTNFCIQNSLTIDIFTKCSENNQLISTHTVFCVVDFVVHATVRDPLPVEPIYGTRTVTELLLANDFKCLENCYHCLLLQLLNT